MPKANEWLAYGAAILLFGAVVLWADEAEWPVIAVFAALAAALLLIMAFPRRTPRVVVVGERTEIPVSPLRGTLGEAGFDVCTCAGPVGRPCPVTLGRACSIGERRPVAAVIFRRPDETGPLPPCSRALFVPSLSVEEGSTRLPEFAGRYARVGWERGPDAVVKTLERLLVA